MTATLIGAGHTDVGRKRQFNEDSFAFDLSSGLLALADGMGGHAAGEVASKIAIDTVTEFIAQTSGRTDISWPFGFDDRISRSSNLLRTAVRLANDRIFKNIEGHEELRGMGTTLVAALIQDGRASVAHVGDSRVYLWRPGTLTQITNDHSWVNEQVGMGLLSREEASRHPFRNVITRALGSREEVAADIVELALEPRERLLLCSDGLTAMLEDREILQTLDALPGDLEAATLELIERANMAGGDDNITVILAGRG